MRTSENKLYLRPNLQLEPLVNQWYAWSHLIAPANAAMNLAFSHLKIMTSYLSAPQVHATAVKNPAMLGGPFIDYQGGRVEEIRELLERTKSEQAANIHFAEAIKELDAMLANEAKGESLEPLYSRVPECLRGYVELTYDLNNHPSIQFLEGLLYRSKFYSQSSQGVCLSLVNEDERPFALSTPRLTESDRVLRQVPFKDPGLEELLRMRSQPGSYSRVKEALEIEDKHDEIVRSFLTEQAPKQTARWKDDGVRVRYFGHACVLIESKNLNILTDPVISYEYESGIQRYTYADLPEVIDYVLITHGHQDHFHLETLLNLRHKIRNIIVPRSNGGALQDPSLKWVLTNLGFQHVQEIAPLETLSLEGAEITGLPFLGEHADLNIKSKIGHLVRMEGKTILCAADSNNLEPKLYSLLHDLVGDLDVLFLGMECEGAPLSWLYGPLLTRPITRKADFSRTLSGSDFPRALALVKEFNVRQVYIYAMGQEPWLNYFMSKKYTSESKPIVESDKLIQECRRAGIAAERLFGVKDILV